MKNHKFKFAEKYGERNVFLVKCKNTGGEFSTKLWDNLLVSKGVCPCCKEKIIK